LGPYQKYWLDSGVQLPYFGALYAGYNLVAGFGGRLAPVGTARYGRRAILAAAGVLQVLAYFGMAAFLGWGGIALGFLVQVSGGTREVLLLNALNERIASGMRATVISMASLSVRASFSLLGPVVGYGIDGWGLPSVLSALGILCAIAFVVLLLPLILREAALSPRAQREAPS
jgi:MFS family permease